MKKTLLSGSAIFALLLASCSSDDALQSENGNGTSEIDQTLYVSMSISGDVGDTRASSDNGAPNDDDTDFSSGTNENKVNNAYFVFYDADGMVVGDIIPVALDDLALSEVPTPSGTVEKAYNSVVSVSVRKGEKKPNRVICYINPISPSTLQVPLSTIQTVTRQQVYTNVGTERYFAMSNSVYYNDESTATSTPQIAVSVPEAALYKSETEAKTALTNNENVVNIYVERYAAKLAFKVEQAATPYTTVTRVYDSAEEKGYKDNSVELTFVPQYWALNAEAADTYVIKSFRKESTDGQILPDNYTYGTLDSYII